MPDNLPIPRILKTTQGTQFSYELPHRIHNATVYPAQSVNGSTVLLYGHEHGVKIIWTGGRSLKPTTTRAHAPGKTNGAETAVISLDSDEEESPADKYDEKAEFEDEEIEDNSAGSYPKIVQTLDLHLGAAALHLAVLPALMTKADQSLPQAYHEYCEKIIFVAACSDNYLRLVTLPLTPPSPESKARSEFRKYPYNTVVGNGSWGERITRLSGHQRPADGVSLSLDIKNHTKKSRTQDVTPSTPTETSIIVSSHSREISGLLLLFRVSLKTHVEQLEPFQTIYLPSPATAISFNSSTALPRATYLLVAEASGTCRIYDYSSLSRSTEEQLGVVTEQGSWLLSLYPGFQNRKNDTNSASGFGRKTIIDAKWVSGGRAIIALLDDGEWIVWDVEGASPVATQGLLGRQGVVGGSKTAYSLSGYIENGDKRRVGLTQSTISKFAPMTPATRKLNEPFGISRAQAGFTRGQLSVSESPSTSSTRQPDDSVSFWFGETFAFIPNLNSYWSSHQTGSTNPFVGASGGRVVKVEGVDLQGERCSGIAQIPPHLGTRSSTELLIVGEHQFSIFSIGKTSKKLSYQGTGRLALTEKSSHGGELADIDRALALMDRDSKMELF